MSEISWALRGPTPFTCISSCGVASITRQKLPKWSISRCARVRILARNGQVQHIFQHFVFGQAFHAVVRHTLLHAGTMILVNRPLFAVCHGSTSFLPLYVFLISLYTERKIGKEISEGSMKSFTAGANE